MNFSFTSGDATIASQPTVGGRLRCAVAYLAQVGLSTVSISSVTDAGTGAIVRLASTSATNTDTNCSITVDGDVLRRLVGGFPGFSRAAVSAGFTAEVAIQIFANASVRDPSGTGASVISQQLAQGNEVIALLMAAASSGSILLALTSFAAAIADALGISAETVLAGASSTTPTIRTAIARSATPSPSPPPAISALLNTNTTAISVAVPLVVVFCLGLSFVVYLRRSRRYAEDHSLALALARKGVQSKFAPFSFSVDSREKRPVVSSSDFSEVFDVVEGRDADAVRTFSRNPIFSSRNSPLEVSGSFGGRDAFGAGASVGGAGMPGTPGRLSSRSPSGSAVLPPHAAASARTRRNPILRDAESDARARPAFTDFVLPHTFIRDRDSDVAHHAAAAVNDTNSPQSLAAVARMTHVLSALSRNRRVGGGDVLSGGGMLGAAGSPLGPAPSPVLPTASRISTLLGGFRATGATSALRTATTRNMGDNDPTTNPTRFALGPSRF